MKSRVQWGSWFISLIVYVSSSLYLCLDVKETNASTDRILLDPQWIQSEKDYAKNRLFLAISPSDGAKGAVMASPSRSHPNYYYHWIRDAALTMDTFYTFEPVEGASKIESLLLDYINFSRRNQLTDNPSGLATERGLGEPKFQIDGGPFLEGWGRPQNDGPALRTLTLLKLAYRWLENGNSKKVSDYLYRAELPANTLLKADLEYVAHHWNEPNFDLWEETKGIHFYTLMVQMTALYEGAKFATIMGDSGAAQFYNNEAKAIENNLSSFWSNEKGYYLTTLSNTAGITSKTSNLDVAIILGVLHSKRTTGNFSITDPKVLQTAVVLENVFQSLYKVNQKFPNESLAPGIGRYPEDTYNGYDTNGKGNPWYLCTLALSEFYYKLSVLETQTPLKKIYFNKAEAFLSRVKKHVNGDGSLSEQFNRDSGFAEGAVHLTWSYAAYITTIESRTAALNQALSKKTIR